MYARPTLVELSNIWKSFGAVRALRGVSFDVRPGETHALVGDNGAGKTTLMKILSGVYRPDRGEITVAGEKVSFSRPRDSRDLGIEMIYQDFALAENLDIRSNIFLGRERRRKTMGGLLRVLDNRYMDTETRRVLASLDVDIDPGLKVRRLSAGQRQAVAIGRALAFDAKLVIMDEPTANLAIGKVEKLLELTERLRDLGIAVILISHRMDEVFSVADRLTVLRQGQVVGRFRSGELSESRISNLIARGLPDPMVRRGDL
ncbi:ATP-binding cassette domain-containing protein [Actinopolymorpha alba]|uniref:ATP-binding cassette domain-containing protein n=1 Tax=Actinopolymorpha alba TaxID=533267 RepID=UPI00037CA56D|nr:ATP-binding cassette domain-containing protein [Actinopolymorpha alba]